MVAGEVRRGRPRSRIPAMAAHDHDASSRSKLCELPDPTGIQTGESSVTAVDPASELADLRLGWGDAYRITWDSSLFRATHIVSGQALDAGKASELRRLLRDQHS
jgi:hypothetical protein